MLGGAELSWRWQRGGALLCQGFLDFLAGELKYLWLKIEAD